MLSLEFLNNKKSFIADFLNNNFKEVLGVNNKDVQIYLLGGAIKDLTQNITPKDIDIVFLTSDSSFLDDFINNNNFNYNKNSFGGYKINHNELIIDMWATNDLYKTIEYNLDGLFYDIKNNLIIPFGFIDGVETKRLFYINENNKHPLKEMELERRKKLKKYIERTS